MPPPTFVPGLDLSERFYREAVRPILDREFPGLVHSAALIGYGSEVLGFDTARSTDHNWGPRCLLFLSADDATRHGDAIWQTLSERLPTSFLCHSTHFGPLTPDGSVLPEVIERGPVDHKVEVHGPDWFADWLGHDPREPWGATEWLTVPRQRLGEVTGGRVFHDGLGLLGPIRSRLAWYPDQVWRYLLACQWQRISQQEPFVGRTGDVGDDLGSRILAATLARDAMHLAFLMERRYAPYGKWFGTAFKRLAIAGEIAPMLEGALAASDWRERERHLCDAYELLGGRFDALGLAPPVAATRRNFHERPYQVIDAWRFVVALDATMTAPDVRAVIDAAGRAGSLDQVGDNVDFLTRQHLTRRATVLYGQG